MDFLTEKNLSKLEKTFLKLKENIYEALTNQSRLKALHHYTFFVSLVLEKMNENSTWQDYFLKDTIYTLLNLIHNFKHSNDLIISVANFLMIFLKKIVSDFSGTFSFLLPVTINSLKHFYKTLSSIKDVCMEMMNFLIVDNSCFLMDVIEKLDNFPNNADFEKIRIVHSNIKYGKMEITLEKEIESFLQHRDHSTRLDSLIHLKNVLSEQKTALKQIGDQVETQNGFSEDCENSLLHRLIAALVNMSNSTDEKVIIKCFFN